MVRREGSLKGCSVICPKEELNKLGLRYVVVELGMVEIPEDITQQQRDELKKNLLKSGLELLDDKKSILIEKIKNVIIEMIHSSEEGNKINYSDHISKKLKDDYTNLSNIFSEVKGITIQQFIITTKIERIKELLLYDEINLTEIAYKFHYSSVAHLSNQFKKITGLSPSFFKKLGQGAGKPGEPVIYINMLRRHVTVRCLTIFTFMV